MSKDNEPNRFRNHYRCERCGHEWSSDWSCQVDDDCPSCGARHMSPTSSDDLDEHGNVAAEDTSHERDTFVPPPTRLAAGLRKTAEGAGLTGRWICHINFDAPDGGHDPNDPPDGYYDADDIKVRRKLILAQKALYAELADETDLPEISAAVEDWQHNQLMLSRTDDGTLRWLWPAVWEAYTDEEQERYLETCADDLRKAADVIDEMAAALAALVADVRQLEGYWTEGTDDLIQAAEKALAKIA